jgi:hypothetical protein
MKRLVAVCAVLAGACGGSDGFARKRDAGSGTADAAARDTGKDTRVVLDGGAVRRDSGSQIDGGALDMGRAVDAPWYTPDASTVCHVDITPVTPATLVALTAGPTASLRVQGTVTWEQTPPFLPAWSWSVTRSDGKVIETKEIPGDPGQIQFSLATAGRYDITVDIGNGCGGTARALVQDSSSQFRIYRLRALPPDTASAAVPYEVDVRVVAGSASTNKDIEFDTGASVTIDPTTGTASPLPVAVPSYIRIESAESTWVSYGRSNNQGPFRTVLDLMLEYQVLVIPDPPSDGSEAFPPYLLSRATSNNVKVDARYIGAYSNPLPLPRGIPMAGYLLGPDGPVEGATISLRSYQSDSAAGQSDLLFSTVGRAGRDGHYALRVNPAGNFSIVVTPPPGSTLPVATIEQAINLTSPTTQIPQVDFQWAELPTTDLSIAVTTPEGRVASGVAVHVESSSKDPLLAGVLVPAGGADGGTASWQPPPAVADIRRDAITDRYGSVTFPALPKTSYEITLVPAAAGSGITKYKAEARQASEVVQIALPLLPKVMVVGRLLDARDDLATDSAGAKVVATDLGRDTIAPVATATVAYDGSFILALDPDRTYSLSAQPAQGRGLPSFIPLYGFSTGRSLLQLDLQRIPKGILVQGHVTYAGGPIAGAVLQAFCVGLAPDCADRTNLAAGSPPAFASAISDASGSYAFYLPDPATAE